MVFNDQIDAAWVFILQSFHADDHFARVWEFNQAPLPLQNLADNNGDDCDWLAITPKHFPYRPLWMESLASARMQTVEVGDWLVYIGSHA